MIDSGMVIEISWPCIICQRPITVYRHPRVQQTLARLDRCHECAAVIARRRFPEMRARVLNGAA